MKIRDLLASFSLLFFFVDAGALAENTPVSVTGYSGEVQCQKYANTTPLCFFSNPEDLALLPDKETLLVSEFGDNHGTEPGALVFYDITTQTRRLGYSGDSHEQPTEYWGDKSCEDPPGTVFSPHGIDLSQRADGRWQLLVVQHGGRESIEFFELVDTDRVPRLLWRGCAVASEDTSLNSVAAGRDGELFATKMQSTSSSWNADPGSPSGLVYRWSKRSGFDPVPRSEGHMLNGIAASKDGKTLFVVYSGENLVKKIDAQSGEVLDSAVVKSVDNIKWSADAQVLVAASFTGSASVDDFARCTSAELGVCPIAFSIVELNPGSLEEQTLFYDPNAPMGAGTVGLKVGSTLFIGTFSGNRILQVDMAEPGH
ncbi:hypothetical protein DWB85_14150 [Seongchinamella sediminis]|uniref:SMP-30/Gluconolactonase/LRE-like region domain-containing protein n=1 Tax=Seongchinamella sediminis TaxID=2283635 RepID=A0A3L7DTW9_9GAMM|nr:SMP-30/gluconolactonase/LRE family protein [Seongchinamella sediminis]RLQ21037.1 hypothetical protein DWB85_14150 [Seongchinamella sediminis]